MQTILRGRHCGLSCHCGCYHCLSRFGRHVLPVLDAIVEKYRN